MDNLEAMVKLYQNETKPEPQSTLSPEKAALIQAGLKKLLSYGLLNNPDAVRDWANGLADLSEEALRIGFNKAKDHTGYMTFGDFRKLCRVPTLHPSHQPFKALPKEEPLPPEEIHKRIAKMREELDL